MMLERPTRRSLKICALLLPIYLLAMVANNRRLAWTELTMVVIFFFLITPLGRIKRFFVRAMVVSLLPLLVYGAAGWSSQGGRLFAPVRTFRSLFDAARKNSSRARRLIMVDSSTALESASRSLGARGSSKTLFLIFSQRICRVV